MLRSTKYEKIQYKLTILNFDTLTFWYYRACISFNVFQIWENYLILMIKLNNLC